MAEGSIDDTVDRILLWSRLTPQGLALVEFQSKPARQQVISALRESLSEEGCLFHELSLAQEPNAIEVVHRLVDDLRIVGTGVVSLGGFGRLFSPERPTAELASAFNFNRERLAAPPLRQIWWMPPHVVGAFRHGAPDLFSWFRAHWHLTEVVAPENELELFTDFGKEPRPKDLDDARRRASYLTERFDRALGERDTPTDLIDRQLLRPAVWSLREVGAEREARKLEAQLRQKLPRPPTPWSIPYPRNTYFTGREDVLDGLRRQLAAEGRVVLGQTAAISGLGGIGKTQTAVEYAWRHREDYGRGVFFVHAASEGQIVSRFAEIAELVGLEVGGDQGQAADAAKRWLEETEGWLLILDNVDEPAVLTRWLPPAHRGHVIITSRASTFAALGVGQPFQMATLPRDDAVAFLLARTRRTEADAEEMDAARELGKELGYLPLALEQAGAYTLAHEDRFADYLASYKRRGLKLLSRAMPEVGGHPTPVATTWSINFDKVQEVSPAAADVLRTSAVLGPDAIPEEILTEGGGELGPTIAGALRGDDPLAVGELLAPLLRYSLIERDAAARTWSVHRLVQAVVKDNLGERVTMWTDRGVNALGVAFPWPEFENWAQCERLSAHVLTVAPSAKDSLELATLLNSVGWYFYQRGRYTEAEPCYERSLRIHEKEQGAEHREVAAVVNNLAALLADQGRYPEAEFLCHRALRIFEKVLDKEDLAIAMALSNLAALYVDQGRYEEAEPLYERALDIRKALLGDGHPDVAMTLSNLAASYYRQRRYADALSLYEPALRALKQELGDEHPMVAMALNNLAALHAKEGRYDEAEKLFRRVIDIRENILGDDHPDFASALKNLAALYANRGRCDEAEPLLRRSLRLFEKRLGTDHPETRRVREDLARVQRSRQSPSTGS